MCVCGEGGGGSVDSRFLFYVFVPGEGGAGREEGESVEGAYHL